VLEPRGIQEILDRLVSYPDCHLIVGDIKILCDEDLSEIADWKLAILLGFLHKCKNTTYGWPVHNKFIHTLAYSAIDRLENELFERAVLVEPLKRCA